MRAWEVEAKRRTRRGRDERGHEKSLGLRIIDKKS
uniref:Uncharacterized protein n=1 Tax=Aquilaria malaccensis TaxID=223753 RepID=A0A4Y6GLT8_9ROSI|nr:hypothetical protein [Aquilaria malaccensis]